VERFYLANLGEIASLDPKVQIEWLRLQYYIYTGLTLPGGLVTLYDGRNHNETPLWLPEQRTIVLRLRPAL